MTPNMCMTCKGIFPDDELRARSYHRRVDGGKTVYKNCVYCQSMFYGAWTPEQREIERIRNLTKQRRLRESAIFALGGECATCGYDENLMALEVDHINENGGEERRIKSLSTTYKEASMGLRKDLQVLCSICHSIKSRTYRKASDYL